MRKIKIGAMVLGLIWFLAMPLQARDFPLQPKDGKPLSKESLDESVRLLSKSGQYIDYMAISSRKHSPAYAFAQTLSAPRARKVLDEIDDLGKSKKTFAKCEEIFNHTFKEYKEVVDAALKHYEVPGTPPNKKSLDSRLHAVCTSILCFAQLGYTDEVLKKLETVHSFLDKTEKRIVNNEKAFPKHFWTSIRHYIRPSDNYTLNVLLYSCSQNNEAQCEKIVKELKVPVGTWVDIAEWHEFPRPPQHPANQHLAKPIKMVMAYDWPKGVAYDPEKQKALLKRLEGLLKPTDKTK